MPVWKCTNKRWDGTLCNNTVTSPDIPLGLCKSCKLLGNWVRIDERGPRMTIPVFDDQPEIVKRVEQIISGLRQFSLDTYFPGEIVKFVKEVSSDVNKGWKGRSQDLARVKSRLHPAWQFYNNADYLFKCIAARRTSKLIAALDVPLQRKWNVAGGLLGDMPDYEKWATNTFMLREYGKAGIVEAQRIWETLQTDEDREKFIYFVYEHEKGYHQIVEHCKLWKLGMRPQEQLAPKDEDLIRGKGVGGFSKQGGIKQVVAISAAFGLEKEIRNGISGEWKDRVFHVDGLGSIKLTEFNRAKKEYTYVFLGV